MLLEHVQLFFTMVKSNILPYKFAYLSTVKNNWQHSKNIERGQQILNETKFFLNQQMN